MPVKAKPMAPAAAPSPWDVAFGTAFTTDYDLRGISQSDHKPAVQGYFEVDYTATDWLKLYAGVWGSSLYTGFADAEFDISGGARFTWGNFGLDLGYVYYEYPDGVRPERLRQLRRILCQAVVQGRRLADRRRRHRRRRQLQQQVCADCCAWVGDADADYYSGNAVITLPWHPITDVDDLGQSRDRPSMVQLERDCHLGLRRATPTGMSASTSTTRPSRSICVTGTPTRHVTRPMRSAPVTGTRGTNALRARASSRRSSSTPRSSALK